MEQQNKWSETRKKNRREIRWNEAIPQDNSIKRPTSLLAPWIPSHAMPRKVSGKGGEELKPYLPGDRSDGDFHVGLKETSVGCDLHALGSETARHLSTGVNKGMRRGGGWIADAHIKITQASSKLLETSSRGKPNHMKAIHPVKFAIPKNIRALPVRNKEQRL